MRRYPTLIVTFFLPVSAMLGGAALSNGCAHDQIKRPTQETYGQPQDDEQRTAVRSISAEPVSNGVSPATYEVNGVTQTASGAVIDPASAEKLTNDKIVKVVRVVNEAQMEQAQLAVRRATDPRVRAFANEMLHDQNMAETKEQNLVSADRLAAADSSTSDLLRHKAHKTMEQLAELRGADLDRTYVTTQVEEHSAALELIDDHLLPQATDPNVKSVLQQIRPIISRHLEQALTLQTRLKASN